MILSVATNPLGPWRVYVIDVTNDGTHGTPDWKKCGGVCLFWYPNLGNDQFGFYLTTTIYGYDGSNFLVRRHLASQASRREWVKQLAPLPLGFQHSSHLTLRTSKGDYS